MGRILSTLKARPKRNESKELALRLPADKWISEHEALQLIYYPNAVPNDYARSIAPLHYLMSQGMIRRRGGVNTPNGSEVYRYASVAEIHNEGEHPVAAIDPRKPRPVYVGLTEGGVTKKYILNSPEHKKAVADYRERLKKRRRDLILSVMEDADQPLKQEEVNRKRAERERAAG